MDQSTKHGYIIIKYGNTYGLDIGHLVFESHECSNMVRHIVKQVFQELSNFIYFHGN